MERERDIQKLVNAVLGDKDGNIASYTNDYNNGDYWECPFCYEEFPENHHKDIGNPMELITHSLDCAYLIAKDLKV